MGEGEDVMGKIIIDNQTPISDIAALVCVARVIEMGRISETSRGKQYCFATSFGERDAEGAVVVMAVLNRKSDRFLIVVNKTIKEEPANA